MNQKYTFATHAALASAFGLSLLTAKSASALVLVEDGQAKATIVVAQDAGPQVQQVAQTLQQYIQQSSGAKLPIAATAEGAAINVGQTAAVKKAGIDAAKLDQDGFVLQGVDGHNYAIVGGSDWGTEFGVYDFLERYLGVRWLMPMELGTDVPLHATINVPDVKIVQQPVYLSRQLSPLDIEGADPKGKWARFNRARGRIAFHHNLLHLFPVSEFGKTHPEFYPMIDGKRHIPTDAADESWQPNFSAPGIVDAAVEQIDKYFQEHPEATSYSLGMNDSNGWDQSDASKARRNGKNNFLGVEDISDDYFAWANAVVERVLVKYPDKWFGTLAYLGLSEPPTKVKVNPRIVPFITYDRMRWEDPALRESGHQLNERWEKASPVLGWYDYIYGHSYELPRVYPHRMQKYLSYGAAHGVEYSYAELYPNWGEGPKPWIFTKLLWNPNQNVDALQDDWYTHFAGVKAAPKLKDFYAVWEKFWTTDVYKSKWISKKGQYLAFYTVGYLADVPESYVTQSEADMQAALQLADTPQRKARVAKLKEMWDFYKASIIAYQGENLASDPQSEAQALALLDKAESVMTEARKRQELLAAFEKDPLYSASAAHIREFPETAGQSWGASLLWGVQSWAQKSSAVKARLQKLAESPDAVVREQAVLVLQTVDGKSTLVTSNASFEEESKGWSFWDKSEEGAQYHKGTWTVSTAQAHSGTHSLLVKGLGRGAPIQVIPYQAGTYFATAHCYVPQGSKTGTASLMLQALGPKDEVLGAPFVLPASNIALQPDAWSNITVGFTLPQTGADQAASLRIMVVLDHFDPDGEIYLDDVGIYRLEK